MLSVLFTCWATLIGIPDIHISEEGVASWDLPDGAQQSLYYEFRVKVEGTGQEDHYLNVVIASVRYYNLSLLRLPPGNYAVQVSTNDGNVINPRRAHALARVTVVGLSVCLSVRTKSASTSIYSKQVLYVRVFRNECKV